MLLLRFNTVGGKKKVLLLNKDFKYFGIPRGSPKVNYFAFVDDMLILCKDDVITTQYGMG